MMVLGVPTIVDQEAPPMMGLAGLRTTVRVGLAMRAQVGPRMPDRADPATRGREELG